MCVGIIRLSCSSRLVTQSNPTATQGTGALPERSIRSFHRGAGVNVCLIDNSVKPLTECIALQVNWHYFMVDQLCNIKVIESTKGKRHFEVLSLVPFLIILLERYAYIHTIPALFRFKSHASPLSVFIPSSLALSALHQSSYLGGGGRRAEFGFWLPGCSCTYHSARFGFSSCRQ